MFWSPTSDFGELGAYHWCTFYCANEFRGRNWWRGSYNRSFLPESGVFASIRNINPTLTSNDAEPNSNTSNRNHAEANFQPETFPTNFQPENFQTNFQPEYSKANTESNYPTTNKETNRCTYGTPNHVTHGKADVVDTH